MNGTNDLSSELNHYPTLAENPYASRTHLRFFKGKHNITSGTKTIIDDILIYCSNKSLILLYFECICTIFHKNRARFFLDKCEFLEYRKKYVGQDINLDGNCPAQYKFDMINDYKQPVLGQNIFSFVGLNNFYHQFAPYLELKLKPLSRLCRTYYQQPITIMAWSPDRIALFHDLKVTITSYPVLSCFEPEKPIFLKTDWSAEGMGWILMYTNDDEEYPKATTHLKKLDNAYLTSIKMAPD